MKTAFLSGLAALAFIAASPAIAGNAAGGVAVGPTTGTVSTSSSDGLSINHQNDLSISINNTLTASSGSGFGGTLSADGLLNGNLIAGGSIASFSGGGTAYSLAGGLVGSNTTYASYLPLPVTTSYGIAGSISGSNGSFTASAVGNAQVNGQVMNFGQSEFTKSFTLDYTHKSDFSLTDNSSQSFTATTTGQMGGVGGIAFDDFGPFGL